MVEDVVCTLWLPARDHFPADNDTPFGEAEFFPDLRFKVPTCVLDRRRDKFRADVSFGKVALIQFIPVKLSAQHDT